LSQAYYRFENLEVVEVRILGGEELVQEVSLLTHARGFAGLDQARVSRLALAYDNGLTEELVNDCLAHWVVNHDELNGRFTCKLSKTVKKIYIFFSFFLTW